MRPTSLVVVLAAIAACAPSGPSVGYTLRFETVSEKPPDDTVNSRAKILDVGGTLVGMFEDLYVLESDATWDSRGDLDTAFGATAVGSTLVALRDQGVTTSTDFRSSMSIPTSSFRAAWATDWI